MLRLHVVNTGWAYIWDKDLYWGGRKELRALPVLAFIIEHPRGLLIFDTGLDPSIAARPRTLTTRFGDCAVRFRSSSEMALSQQMRERGLPSEDVKCVALSHLHCDHTGDLRAFSQAAILVTHQEWQAARSPFGRVKGYGREQYAGLAPTLVDCLQRRS
jgi:metal-dependent hydrolase (beta-lactamase superfamily II)